MPANTHKEVATGSPCPVEELPSEPESCPNCGSDERTEHLIGSGAAYIQCETCGDTVGI